MSTKSLTIDGNEIEITHADKVMFPDAGITKSDLVDYYVRIAERMLPHLRERPLTMQRFPDGIGEDGFFQKQIGDYFPDWIDRVELDKEDGKVTHVVANDAASLAYLAQQGCIALHIGLADREHIDRPDRLVFDLDPADDDFAEVIAAAKQVRQLRSRLELECFVQTTGSRGLHVVVPLDCESDFDEVRAFARSLAERLATEHSDRLTVEQRKNQRRGRIFIDYLRNAYGQTVVASYSIRAKPGAPIATPIAWSELTPDLRSDRYTIDNIFRRLGRTDDPWRKFRQSQGNIEQAVARLETLHD